MPEHKPLAPLHTCLSWAENSPSGRARCQRKATPRGAGKTHNPLLLQSAKLNNLPNPLLSGRKTGAVLVSTETCPTCQSPTAGALPVSHGTRKWKPKRCPLGRANCRPNAAEQALESRCTQRPRVLMVSELLD